MCFYTDWTESQRFCQIDGSPIIILTLKSDIVLHIRLKCVQIPCTCEKNAFKFIYPTESCFTASLRGDSRGVGFQTHVPQAVWRNVKLPRKTIVFLSFCTHLCILIIKALHQSVQSLKVTSDFLQVLCLVKRRKADSM